ncbi:MAG: Rrf2 family transcriptional regulator [Candidatus Promineifilaceae bacterium]|nr:Rrf2 family transcriptional regulator [Anaerolineaceae bacterium]
MFQISRRVDYAVRIMIELGMQPEGAYLSARRVSSRTAVPKAFLHKITADLVRAGLILTQTGPSGGLALQKPSNQINLLDVVEAIEGPVCLNICLTRPQECNRDRFCPGHEVWGRLQMMVVAELRNSVLADLVLEARRLQKNPRTALVDFPYIYAPKVNGSAVPKEHR